MGCSMNDHDFIQLGNEILSHMPSNYQEFCQLSDKMRSLQLYILMHPHYPSVRLFIRSLLDYYIQLFFDKDLVLATKSERYYFQKIAMYQALPTTKNYYSCCAIFELLNLDSFPNFYDGFLEAISFYRGELISNEHIKQVCDFTMQNDAIMRGSSDIYGTLEEEIGLYQKASSGYSFDALKQFASDYYMQPDKARFHFMNKHLGNIGELLVFQAIPTQPQKIFVARDIKNGFGYDIYFYDKACIENLIEVKTTRNNGEHDFFTMSENEYHIMRESREKGNARYSIFRMKLDQTPVLSSYLCLDMMNEETLVDRNNPNIVYQLNPKFDSRIQFDISEESKKVLMKTH